MVKEEHYVNRSLVFVIHIGVNITSIRNFLYNYIQIYLCFVFRD